MLRNVVVASVVAHASLGGSRGWLQTVVSVEEVEPCKLVNWSSLAKRADVNWIMCKS